MSWIWDITDSVLPRNVKAKCVDCGADVITGEDNVDDAPKCADCRDEGETDADNGD